MCKESANRKLTPKEFIEAHGRYQQDNHIAHCPQCGRLIGFNDVIVLCKIVDVYICLYCATDISYAKKFPKPVLPFSEWALCKMLPDG